jgi:hypothetical protein
MDQPPKAANFFKQRRTGRFSIPIELVDNHPKMVAEMMRGMIVVRCEFMLVPGRLEYVAMAPFFEPVPLGTEAPRYTCSTVGDRHVWSVVDETS